MQEKVYEQSGVAMTCRSFDEYERMFALTGELLREGPVLDVAGGASSFVAEACSRGVAAQAADPLYAMEPEDIRSRGRREIESSTAKLEKLKHVYDWSYYGSLDNHRSIREQSLERFAGHYSQTQGTSVYTAAALPKLPFADESFSLVLCSHFLFLYSEQFDYAFHLEAVRELLRVCRQGGAVMVYPLYSLNQQRYASLDRLISDVEQDGVKAHLSLSGLAFIPGSTERLTLRK
ncbi:hypothetical protein SK3146_02001 [Paenibacillus konkukensis]|uniref:Methyltransferase type 11 domain-containing protein n=1 Tax=Paenibacillus konkukensis TaxID=2020716 RepID=A0ABY4RLS3_9BACL|nr:methyltransferase domain-containing protein [Paenibacillus konkukensis]UQZ82841.1 hypothetical protein SK3146_02001 [Paenibacillus konkukensis]